MKCQNCQKDLGSLERFCAQCGAAAPEAPGAAAPKVAAATSAPVGGWMMAMVGLLLVIVLQNFLILYSIRSHSSGNSTAMSGMPAGHPPIEADGPPAVGNGGPMMGSMPPDQNVEMVMAALEPGRVTGEIRQEVQKMFTDGKSIREVFDKLVGANGIEILTPQAKEIYMARRRKQRM